jgi:hypothetical protein
MRTHKLLAAAAAVTALSLAVTPALAGFPRSSSAAVSGDQISVLSGETPAIVRHGQAALVGAHDPAAHLSINVGIPLRNQAELADFIATQASHGSFMTQQQFDQEFGPTPQQIQAVEAWGSGYGLRTAYTSPDGAIITLTGTTSSVARALTIHLNDYRSKDGKGFYSTDRDPSVPAALGIGAIDGLDNIVRVRTMQSRVASMPSGGYIPELSRHLRCWWPYGQRHRAGRHGPDDRLHAVGRPHCQQRSRVVCQPYGRRGPNSRHGRRPDRVD